MTSPTDSNSPEGLLKFVIALNATSRKAWVVHEPLRHLEQDALKQLAVGAAEVLYGSLQLSSITERFGKRPGDLERTERELPDWDYDPDFSQITRSFEIEVLREVEEPTIYLLDCRHSGEAKGAFPELVVASTMLAFYVENLLPLVLGEAKFVGKG